MNGIKRKRIESKGWKVGTTADFLNLSPAEVVQIEAKLALGKTKAQSDQLK